VADEAIPSTIEGIERRLLMASGPAQKLGLLRRIVAELHAANPLYTVSLAGEGIRLATKLRDRAAAADILRYRGLCHLALRRFDVAEPDLREAFEIFADLDAPHDAAVAAHAMGRVREGDGDQRDAMAWYRKSLEIAADDRCTAIRPTILESLGGLHAGLGSYAEALGAYFDALPLLESLGEGDGMGSVLMSIGIVYGLTEDYAAAFDYFTRSATLFRSSGSRYLEVRALTNLGSIHYLRGELDAALECALTAITVYEALGDTKNIGGVLVMIGNIYQKRGEPELALEFQMRAYAIVDQAASDDLRIPILINIGRLHVELGAHEEGRFAYEQALNIAGAIGELRLQYEIHQALAELFEKTGQPAQALDHYKRFMRIKEDVAGHEKQRLITELQVRFDIDTAEREREIYRLKAQQLESEMRLKQNELAAMALNILQKKELLEALQSELKELKKGDSTAAVDRILTVLDGSRSAEQDWKLFEQQLDNLHHDFVRTLSERYPALTPTELKICSLARINLLTKDIANLLYTSIRTVDAHKYNIRKKLDLPAGASLTTFLIGL
jgi:tetratricopeptide (TPR) repeat protein